jgi:hypothetical protein
LARKAQKQNAAIREQVAIITRENIPHKRRPRSEHLSRARAIARENNEHRAKEFRAAVMPLIVQARKDGCTTTRQIADWLNARGHVSSRGFKWVSAAVHRVLKEDG